MVVSSRQSNWYVRAGSLSQLSFRGWAWPGRLILLLNHTLRNIMRIIGPWDRGSQPRIQRVLEGRQVFATEFWGGVMPAQLILLLKRSERRRVGNDSRFR